MNEIEGLLKDWDLDSELVLQRVYQAATPRERERWHALWLLARGWSAAKVAAALSRDAHTVGDWLEHFRLAGPEGLLFIQTGGSPQLRL